ncbi:MAG: GAF domain-containing protein [Alphaproteobacteria bacterium]|nr:GAF domain-containing protein [Alphaproteobacteria bacterium]
MPNPDFHQALNEVAAALSQPGQPETVYRAIDHATATLIGHKLITMMTFDGEARTVGRVYSNQPEAYPVGGSKPYSASTLFDTLLVERRPVVLRDAADVKRAFVDHTLIASLGCDSGIFLPVAYDGRTLGVMNLAHQAHWYDDKHVALAAPFAALLTTPFLLALRGRS